MAKYKRIGIDLVREPEHTARLEMNDEKLASLMESIKEIGIIEPLIVKPLDEGRYEVIAGHRRLLASRLAGLAEVPCKVETDDKLAIAIKIHENVEREELNAGEEAIFFAELYDQLGEDVDEVCAAVRKSRDYVEKRLNLMRGEPAVREALTKNEINFGVALELNRMAIPRDRTWYLSHACRTGATTATVRQWRLDANRRAELEAARETAPGDHEHAGAAPSPEPPSSISYAHMAKPKELSTSEQIDECCMCKQPRPQFEMYRKFVCRPCADEILVPRELEESRV